MTVLHAIAQVLEPWKTAYSDSSTLSSIVTSVHLGALMFGGGLAVAADRATLRLGRGDVEARARQLGELHATHGPVLWALALLFASGVALAAADIEAFAASPAFWVKLGLVALLLANGAVLARTERALRRRYAGVPDPAARDEVASERLWRRLRRTAALSMLLWTATLVAGAVLVNAA